MADLYQAVIDQKNILAGSAAVPGVTTRRRARSLGELPDPASQASFARELLTLTSLTNLTTPGTTTNASQSGAAESEDLVAAPGSQPTPAESASPRATADRADAQPSIADAVDSPGSNPGADATLASDCVSGTSYPDTLDEDGFVVPKRTVRTQPVARAVSPLSYFSDSGSFFNKMFYDPELEESEQDTEDETPEKVPRKNAGTAWSDYDDGDPFGPIPAGWVIKDPYLGIDSWEPERTSTPVPEQKATVFDDLTEIAMAGMTPKQRKKWRRRQERMVHIQDQGSDTTIVSSDSEGEHSPKSLA
ncbi:hypothetical protein AURDEDRAFT_155215 [Auricularia subglabra TFB-10046 SS5]|nr:hypothetical protein AURDEDRAFT_155215 [Auricularia subglabra TFB-10046 SS5]